MRRPEIVEQLREATRSLAPSVETILFGSEARGDARSDSDIDLLMLVDKPSVTPQDEDEIFSVLYDVELREGISINPFIIPKAEWGKRVTPFYINVVNDAVRL